MSKEDEMRRKQALAQIYLSRLFQIDAPQEVLQPLKNWCIELEVKIEPRSPMHREGLGISDSATINIVDVGGKN